MAIHLGISILSKKRIDLIRFIIQYFMDVGSYGFNGTLLLKHQNGIFPSSFRLQ